VFLDRDGTINAEVNYLYRIADLELIPGAIAAIGRLNRAGMPVIVVTNQAGIARGRYTIADMEALHGHLQALLAEQGAHIDDFFFCPHHPDFTGACACRKPAPGMLLTAAERYGIDLRRSWLVGDSAGDIEAGRAAGCRTVLVRTGYGATYEAALQRGEAHVRPDGIVDALPQAVDAILETRG
jgi:D-glycero-D-manno-heptose 1,7-bisphosphate phosphatase